VYTIRTQLLETVFAHSDMSREEANDRAEDVLDTVDISPARLDDYPHQLSGGMKQRVLLAMSLLLRPELIIADEPTTGLDVITRDRILNDIERYRDEYGVSVLFISHDIADMVETCDSLITMYGGKIVEMGPTDELFQTPTHPYTMGLKHSLPHIDTDPEDLIAMDMDPPENRSPVDECVFADRCPYVLDECREAHPDFTRIGGVESACYRAEEAPSLRDQVDEVDWNK
jgi:oligopeptide/dipeptide ABC transporter ATP-binding protein